MGVREWDEQLERSDNWSSNVFPWGQFWGECMKEKRFLIPILFYAQGWVKVLGPVGRGEDWLKFDQIKLEYVLSRLVMSDKAKSEITKLTYSRS